jgi:hypothetical protein
VLSVQALLQYPALLQLVSLHEAVELHKPPGHWALTEQCAPMGRGVTVVVQLGQSHRYAMLPVSVFSRQLPGQEGSVGPEQAA